MRPRLIPTSAARSSAIRSCGSIGLLCQCRDEGTSDKFAGVTERGHIAGDTCPRSVASLELDDVIASASQGTRRNSITYPALAVGHQPARIWCGQRIKVPEHAACGQLDRARQVSLRILGLVAHIE